MYACKSIGSGYALLYFEPVYEPVATHAHATASLVVWTLHSRMNLDSFIARFDSFCANNDSATVFLATSVLELTAPGLCPGTHDTT